MDTDGKRDRDLSLFSTSFRLHSVRPRADAKAPAAAIKTGEDQPPAKRPAPERTPKKQIRRIVEGQVQKLCDVCNTSDPLPPPPTPMPPYRLPSLAPTHSPAGPSNASCQRHATRLSTAGDDFYCDPLVLAPSCHTIELLANHGCLPARLGPDL